MKTLLESLFFNREFAIAFLSSLFSGLIVILIAWFLTYQYTNLFKKPNLIMVVKQNGHYGNTVQLTLDASGNYEATFWLAIKNTGNGTFNGGEGYWHVYTTGTSTTSGTVPFVVAGENNHLRDVIQYPIYPNSFLDIGPEFRISIQRQDLAHAEIPYFFATSYGSFPATALVNPNTGLVNFKDMGKIEFSPPQ